MVNEKVTDFFIGGLLKESNINFEPNGTNIKEIDEAYKTASKTGTGSVGFPDFTCKVNDFILVIEDKADINKQAKYCGNNNKLDMNTEAVVKYAENGALHYAQHIVKNTSFKKVFAFGCSGNEKHHKIRPIFVDEKDYILLEEVENFKNFSKEYIEKYYKELVLKETPTEVLEVESLVKLSEYLNDKLYKYGHVRDSERPLVVSAILLALDENLDINRLDADHIKKDGDKIYDALCSNLQRVDVGDKEDAIMHQFTFIKDNTTLNTYNEDLGKTPLKYFTEFIKEKVFPSISKSHEDILGFFYGEFIKYSGGDGQSLGIVLTPNHITELFGDLLEIKPTDKVFDPCAGTGGFLISAMNRMLNAVDTDEEKRTIKRNNIHGIEIREDLFTIASTNMILRGDGKSNLILENFFKIDSEELQKKNFTVGMMNPPYSQGRKDTPQLYEINFVKHLLDSLKDNSRCAVIVPQSAMVGKTAFEKSIKEAILKKHTLEGVITLNNNTTFYRIGVHPCIAIFTAHKPHSSEKRSKFINFEDDGYYLAPQIGIIETPRALERKEHLLQCWRDEKDAETKFMVKSKVKYDDEWLHSYYYFNDEIPTEDIFEDTLKEFLSFEFDMVMNGKEYLFEYLNSRLHTEIDEKELYLKNRTWSTFTIESLFDVKGTKTTPLNELKNKNESLIKYPYTTKSDFMGIDGFFNYFTEEGNVITVDSATNGNIHYQGINFSASDHVEKLIPKFKLNYYIAQFIISSLKFAIKNKFDYGYKFNQNRIRKQTFKLPVNKNNKPDYEYMEQYIINFELNFLTKYLNYLSLN